MEVHGTSAGRLDRLSERDGLDDLAHRHFAKQRKRILEAAKVDTETLSESASSVLDWLADREELTIDGIVELLVAARLGVDVEWHRTEVARKLNEACEASARLDAAMARYDERFGSQPGVEL